MLSIPSGCASDASHPCLCCQDDPPAMDFVTAAANLRMHIFSMNMKSRFDVKCECLGGDGEDGGGGDGEDGGVT